MDAGADVEVLALSAGESVSVSANGGSGTSGADSEGGETDGGGVGETTTAGGDGGLLDSAGIVASALTGAVDSVVANSLGVQGSGGDWVSSADGANSAVVVISGFVETLVVVSGKGARRRLPKEEVAAAGNDDDDDDDVGMENVGFTDGDATSAGLNANVDEPNACAGAVFGGSAVDSAGFTDSVGFICAGLKEKPLDPFAGGPKMKPDGVSLSSSVWPTRKPEKLPRVSPVLGFAALGGSGEVEITGAAAGDDTFEKENGSSDTTEPNAILAPAPLAKENFPGGAEIFAVK